LPTALPLSQTMHRAAASRCSSSRFHNTVDETETFEEIITNYFTFIQHVHVQEMDGRYLGAGDAATRFVKAFQTLKDLGYNKWVSLEVFDFTPGGKKIAEESIKVLKDIESKLT